MGNGCLGKEKPEEEEQEDEKIMREASATQEKREIDPANMFRVCKEKDFNNNESKLVHCKGREVVVWKRSGEYYSLDNGCYHHGAALLNGDIEDMGGKQCVVCPWHGYRITLKDGEGLYWGLGEDLKKRTIRSKGVKQRAHTVVVSNEDVFVDINTDPEPLDSDHYSCSGNTVDKGHQQGERPDTTIRLVKKEPVSQSGKTVKYTFKYTDPISSNFDGCPGQAALIDIPELGQQRRWTVVEKNEEGLTIIVKTKLDGVASNWLRTSLKIGQTLILREISDGFGFTNIPAPMGVEITLISGGVGITPMLAILNHCLTGAVPDISCINHFHCDRGEEDLILPELLEAFQENYPGVFQLHLYLTRPPMPWAHESGRITPSAILSHCPTPRHTYVCGPTGFYEGIQRGLVGAGYPRAMIHNESFVA
eukprot:TRINITY_DN14829_c0_g1_i5.p1 TRINITY_DN14829_c0_g1~~TRINITY_DN14829_c0_g1_i5.p1  ORF type:complete len:422 (+),score=23.63 TRINITY_DN14829_c0_g1_i5:573-1838(+)